MTFRQNEILDRGRVIADFRIESLIGRGAMAAVYRAVQVNLDRPVALKVLPADFCDDKDFVERFFNEARAAAALSHPNIVQAYDAGITDDHICYFAMEFVEGENLFDKVEREGPIPSVMVLQILLDMARALDYGWQSQRLNHGDLKPANIMLNERSEAKLADFGLAKIGDMDYAGEGIMLTPLYAAPELILGQSEGSDCRTDIYSFGATFYHLLTGFPPFPGDDPETVMDHQVYTPVTPVIEHNPEIPKNISALVDSMLEKNPGDRPQTWQEVVNDISGLLRKKLNRMAVAVTSSSVARAREDGWKYARLQRGAGRSGKSLKKVFWRLLLILVLILFSLFLADRYWGLIEWPELLPQLPCDYPVAGIEAGLSGSG